VRLIIILLVTISLCGAVPVKIGVIRGGYVGGDWTHAAQRSVQRAVELANYASGLDIILFPEFAFAGIDGGGHSRPEVTFTWDSVLGLVPHPRDPHDVGDSLTAYYLDTLRYIAMGETCYIWAATCGEVLGGINYNSIPIIHPDGRIVRLRRKCHWSGIHDVVRDTTIHLDTINVKAGGRVAVMTTICYENSRLARILDPTEPPAPLWLLPHGTWGGAGNEDMTAATQYWTFDPTPISLSGVWSIVTDHWVRPDAVLIAVDIFSSTRWNTMRIDNYGRDPVAYEPLAWVEVHPHFVIVIANVPDVNDTLPTILPTYIPPPPESLMVMPEISSGPVFLMGASCEKALVLSEDGDTVDWIEISDGEGVWAGATDSKNAPGTYYIVCGEDVRKVVLDY